MGYIDASGKYHKEDAKLADILPMKTSVWKQSDHDRQRQDHKMELLRPYNNDGTPNQAFVEAYPEESKSYGFIKSDDQISKEF